MSYILKGNRISLLPISEYCGLAAKLSSEHGAGRPAAMSSAFHAQAAGAPDSKAKLAKLTQKERDTIATWKKPTPVTVMGHELTYESADKEQPVGLTVDGEWADDGEVVTCGTLDFAWIVDGVAMVADMKKTAWTTSGPDSLQLLAYSYAWAKRHNCKAFCVGLWLLEEAEWVWSETVYYVDGFDALDLWERIVYAAINTSGEASYGPHCSDCYGRLHCPEYTAPAALADSVLGPACAGSKDLEDPVMLGALLAYTQRVKGLIEKVEEHAKEAVRRGVVVTHPETGKVLKHSMCKGKESLNQAKLFAAIPEATRFIERGNPYSRATWVLTEEAKAAAKAKAKRRADPR